MYTYKNYTFSAPSSIESIASIARQFCVLQGYIVLETQLEDFSQCEKQGLIFFIS